MSDEMKSDAKVLNRDIIKYIAMVTMFLNHYAQLFLEPGTLIYEVFLNVGYFTAPVMLYFLVEGYEYTHSKEAYARRLLLFAVLSEVPYCMAFTEQGFIEYTGLNMLFTLLLCFVVILVMEKVEHLALRILAVAALIIVSFGCDWSILAPVFTVLFVRAGKSWKRKRNAFIIAMFFFGFIKYIGGSGRFPMTVNLLYALYSMAGIALGGICILYFYNGKRMQRGKVFSKWFFYLFYPLHLLILGLIRIAAG